MKFIGKIYDGRWKVIECIRCENRQIKYTLENIYNQRTIRIDGRTLRRVEKGETTISKVMAHNIQFHSFAK